MNAHYNFLNSSENSFLHVYPLSPVIETRPWQWVTCWKFCAKVVIACILICEWFELLLFGIADPRVLHRQIGDLHSSRAFFAVMFSSRSDLVKECRWMLQWVSFNLAIFFSELGPPQRHIAHHIPSWFSAWPDNSCNIGMISILVKMCA